MSNKIKYVFLLLGVFLSVLFFASAVYTVSYADERIDNKQILQEEFKTEFIELSLPQRTTRSLNQFQQYYSDFSYEDVIAMNVKFCIQGTITKDYLVTFLYNVFNVDASTGINSYYNLKIDCPILVYNNNSSNYISNWLYVSSITYYVDNLTPSNSYIRFVTNGYNSSGVVTNSAYTEFTNSYTLNQIDNLTLTLYKVNNSNFINYINFSNDNSLNSSNLFQYNENATFDTSTNTISYTYSNYTWNNHYNYTNNNVFSSMFIESTTENLPISVGRYNNNLIDTVLTPGNSSYTTSFTYTFNDNSYPDKIKLFKTYTNITIYNYENGSWQLQTYDTVTTLPILLVLREPVPLSTPVISVLNNILSWSAVSNADYYIIKRVSDNQTFYVNNYTSLSYVLSVNGSYSVQACSNQSGFLNSDFSNVIIITSFADTEYSFLLLMSAIMDSILMFFKSFLNYEIFGVNMFSAFGVILFICLILALLNVIRGKK